jgi:hypothetical protein
VQSRENEPQIKFVRTCRYRSIVSVFTIAIGTSINAI